MTVIITDRNLTKKEMNYLQSRYDNDIKIEYMDKITDYRELKKIYYNLMDRYTLENDTLVFVESVDTKLIMLCVKSFIVEYFCEVNGNCKII